MIPLGSYDLSDLKKILESLIVKDQQNHTLLHYPRSSIWAEFANKHKYIQENIFQHKFTPGSQIENMFEPFASLYSNEGLGTCTS